MPIKSKMFSVFVVAFILTIFIRVFVFEGFIVVGDSMEPTISSGDYVFINKLAFTFSKPERGDIVVTTSRDSKQKIIKRIAGMPEDEFSIGTISTNIDPMEYFVLGDNLDVSIDSRKLGMIDSWDIKGKVFARFRFSELKFSIF
ncbi:MAG: signal peptidase I [Candidatus Zambryskibacteria bacterium]|nr:signal peptidase I [Candidatus Zambryskibacteria bacterium]